MIKKAIFLLSLFSLTFLNLKVTFAQQDIKVENGVISAIKERFGSNLHRSNTENDISIGLEYLNKLRKMVNLRPFSLNPFLSKAAYNHAYYMYINRIVGHFEREGNLGFTGTFPQDRAVYAGYPSRYVGENLSYGEADIYSSIDDLFSAIYHRLGFLSFNYNEIGIGVYQNFYVYDMGNSYIANYCDNPLEKVFGYYYSNVCRDENIAVPVNVFDVLSRLHPRYVVWPPPSSNLAAPVFFEESPDPLPDYSVSGYPISVSFNPYYFANATIKLKSFKMYKVANNTQLSVDNVRLLDKSSDPNHELTSLEFAWFPLERLDWDTEYHVKATFDINGNQNVISWKFRTKSPGMPYYVIDKDEAELLVKSGTKYAIYFKPNSPNDVIHSYNYTYYSGIKIEKSGFVDLNTIYIEVVGPIGSEIALATDTGRRAILKISKEDKAIYPQNNDSAKVLKLCSGWNLVGVSTVLSIATFDIPEVIIIWKYEKGKWYAWSPDGSILNKIRDAGIGIIDNLKPYDGIWIFTAKDVSLELK